MLNCDYWNDDVSIPRTTRGKYIAICGNTGAGKSSLVNAVISRAKQESIKIIGINERVLHHPLLKLMFASPDEYGFLVQLNFLIQRHLILYRWLSIGYTVVIERSHLDDRLFVEHYLQQKHISNEEYKAYITLADLLDKKIPDPDLYIYLDVKPEISMKRLKNSEELGERPKEFPDDDVKFSYVSSWYKKYRDFYEKLVLQKSEGIRFKNTEIIKFDAETDTDFMASEILEHLRKLY